MDLPSRMLLACSLCLLPGKSPLPSVSGKRTPAGLSRGKEGVWESPALMGLLEQEGGSRVPWRQAES